MNELAPIGHNHPPDPIDEAVAPFGDAIDEATNWLDGEHVENEGQMKAVDGLAKEIKAALKAVSDGEKAAAAPLHAAWKAEKARWKPTIDDLTRIKNGLIALVKTFKEDLARKKAEEERKARAEAEQKRRAAEAAAREVNAADIAAQREAAVLQQEALDAAARASQAGKSAPKGLRTVTKYEITDYRAALHDIAKNDRDEMTAFIEDYVRRNHRARQIAGVRVWREKEAY